jgi:hypothetical protein
MFIQYNDTNVHALPWLTYKAVRMKNHKTGKVRTVQKLDTTQAPQDIHWLRPGWNEFPKKVWEQNKDHPQIQKMLRKGKIVLMSEKVTIKKAGKRVAHVVGPEDEEVKSRWFEEKRAVAIVKETFNRDILQRWLDQESRAKVKRAIEKQLEPLMAKAEDDDRADEDEDDESDDD